VSVVPQRPSLPLPLRLPHVVEVVSLGFRSLPLQALQIHLLRSVFSVIFNSIFKD
jgi:hypothetical protein